MKNILIDFRSTDSEKETLLKNCFNPICVPPCKNLTEAECGHPDMLLNILDNKNILVHKDMDISFINKLQSFGYNILKSKNHLRCKYPYNIILNALNIDTIFMHNIKYTDSELICRVQNKKILNIKQGYSKCSTAIVTKNSAITSDTKIYSSLTSIGFDVLLLNPGGIELKGLDYGFIGGTCGLVNDGLLAFFGTLNKYIYGKEVLAFLIKHDVKPLYLSNTNLIDRGSIFKI
ncbi:MAG: hypothetical protein PHX70_12775 [Clostridium sp.]|nr:hypothetical protein [Clostridium sp.]